MAFATVYIYTAELFPTTMRHSLLGICSMTGRVGSILSPQTPLLVSQSNTRSGPQGARLAANSQRLPGENGEIEIIQPR